MYLFIKFSVLQIFLQIILLFLLIINLTLLYLEETKKIFFFLIKEFFTVNFESFIISSLAVAAILFFTLLALYFSLKILINKTTLDIQKSWLLYGFASIFNIFMSAIIIFVGVQDLISFFDIAKFAYALFILFQAGVTLVLLFSTDKTNWNNYIIYNVKSKKIFIIFSVLLVFVVFYISQLLHQQLWVSTAVNVLITINILDIINNKIYEK